MVGQVDGGMNGNMHGWVSHVSVDKDSEFKAPQRLQLLTMVQRLGRQLVLQDVIGQQLSEVRTHCFASCRAGDQAVKTNTNKQVLTHSGECHL